MKLFGKMTLMTFAVMIVASLGFLSPMMVGGAVHGWTIDNPVITLTEYTPTYVYGDVTAGKGYKLPVATVSSGSIESVVATDSTGRKTIASKDETDDCYYLNVDKPGKYDIVYTAKNDSNLTTATRGITVEIVAKGATLAFDENSPYIIPTVAYKGNVITFPNAKVMIDGEESAAEAGNVSISLVALKDNSVKTLPESATATGHKTYTIADSDSGDFKVIYSYTNAGKTISQTEIFRVNSSEQEIALEYSNLSAKLKNLSLEVGVEAELPKPTVINSKANGADVTAKTYTEITVYAPNNQTYKVTDFKFTPKEVGSYRFDYKTVDFFKNEVFTSVTKDKIQLSSGSLAVKVVAPYEALTAEDYSALDLSTMESAECEIPSVLYLDGNEKVVAKFPAIIAKGGWGTLDNVKLTRTIWKNSGGSVGTLESAHTVSGESKTYNANEEGEYELEAGSYEIVYSVKYLDADNNEIGGINKTSDRFAFEVKEGSKPTSASDTHLSITAPSISSTAVLKNADEKLIFNAPSVSDDLDTRLHVTVEYKFGNSGDTNMQTATMNENGKYEIEIKKPVSMADEAWSAAQTLFIIFKVENDFGYTKEVTKEISLLDFSADTAAPVLSSGEVATLEDVVFNYDIGKIVVPTMVATDASTANQTNVTLVMYVMKDNKVIDIYNGDSDNTNKKATLQGFNYEPTQEGDYTFVFVASDQNRNTTTVSTTCRVDFNLGYSVSIAQIPTQEYGDILDLTSVISVTKDGQAINIDNSKIAIASKVTEEMVNAMASESMLIEVTGAYVIDQSGPNGRIKCLDGDIYVKAWAKDMDCDFTNNASSKVSFKSTDSKAPTFTIEGESAGSDVIGTYDFADTTEGNTHNLPWFAEIIDEGTGVSKESLKIEMTYTTDTKPFKVFTVDDLDENNKISFTATKQGRIKVVYSASDEVKGNTTSREFWIYIGDVTAPEIIVANDAITAPTKVGEDVTINLEKITFENDESLSTATDLEVTVKHNGEDVTWSYDNDTTKKNIMFTASEAGDYVITFNVTDKAGNEATTVTKTITVKGDTVKTSNSSTVWGTIMIIISLIVVAGVIYFFVKPSKVKTSRGIKIEGNNSKKNK